MAKLKPYSVTYNELFVKEFVTQFTPEARRAILTTFFHLLTIPTLWKIPLHNSSTSKNSPTYFLDSSVWPASTQSHLRPPASPHIDLPESCPPFTCPVSVHYLPHLTPNSVSSIKWNTWKITSHIPQLGTALIQLLALVAVICEVHLFMSNIEKIEWVAALKSKGPSSQW